MIDRHRGATFLWIRYGAGFSAGRFLHGTMRVLGTKFFLIFFLGSIMSLKEWAEGSRKTH